MRMLTARLHGVGLIVSAVLILLGQTSFVAAQCVTNIDPHKCQRLRRGAIVFEATVDRIEFKDLPKQDLTSGVFRPTAERLIYIRDARAIVGTPQDVLVADVFASEDCYYQFERRRRYVVVATKRDDGRLAPDELSRPIENSRGLTAYVQTLRSSTKSGQLWGDVSMPVAWTNWPVTDGPVAGVRVTAQGPTTRSTTTDAHGEYRFATLPWGAYTVRVDLQGAASFLEPLESQRVEVHAGGACAEVSFNAESRTRIEGVVVDENGHPAPNLFLSLHPADFNNPEYEKGYVPGYGSSTDARGRYVFSNLPPGRFVVGVNMDIGPLPDSPYAGAYATLPAGDTIIPVSIGGRAILEPLRLMRLSPGTISGVVLAKNGEPATGIDVTIWWTTVRGYDRREYPRKTDGQGRFQIPAWQGVAYTLEVGSHDAPSAKIAGPRLNEPITITLPDR